MASAGAGGTLPPNFFLTPQQQSLLFAALNSNKPQQQQQQQQATPITSGLTLSPSSFQASPMQANDKDVTVSETPLFDSVDYNEYADSSFDFSFADDGAQLIGDMPTGPKSDSSENDLDGDGDGKRSHPDDDDDEDDDDERSSPKRRESSDKVPKKPGRKPLTSEPSSKRKAQNRAAQRAFRERKERHLKDLETKVNELSKASKAANHENAKLRLQVERMTSELGQYKQKLSSVTNAKPALARDRTSFGQAAVSNLNDVNFHFNFPKFGTLPGPATETFGQNGIRQQRSASQTVSPQQNQRASPPKPSDSRSPPLAQTNTNEQFSHDLSKFNSMFTPSMSSSVNNGSRASLDSASQNFSLGGATSSPSASSNSNSNVGPSSSCGTSPEPFNQSPLAAKPVETMTTIGEENSNALSTDQGFAQFSNIDFSNTNFDWLAGQNNQFDPQLFGDWREPQDNVLANPAFDDFFNDAVDTDFTFPFNAAPAAPPTASSVPKTSLIDQIDAQKNDIDNIPPPGMKKNMNCNQIWDKLQSCPKAQNGDFDLDGLCSELTKKAKCSGSGPVVAEHEFDSILKKYMGKDVSSDCVADTLGIAIEKDRRPNGIGLSSI